MIKNKAWNNPHARLFSLITSFFTLDGSREKYPLKGIPGQKNPPQFHSNVSTILDLLSAMPILGIKTTKP